jgi:RecG-like helicase
MNYKKAIKIIVELAQKEVDTNESAYDVPTLFKDSEAVNLEKIEQAFDVVEEEVNSLPY